MCPLSDGSPKGNQVYKFANRSANSKKPKMSGQYQCPKVALCDRANYRNGLNLDEIVADYVTLCVRKSH